MIKWRVGIVVVFMWAACVYSGCRELKPFAVKEAELMHLPAGFPSMKIPEGNAYTRERWELGKKLFYEKALSLHYTISCSSCHHPSLAFSDSLAFSPGDLGAMGTSNAPSLANIGYHPYFLRGGSVPTLEMQVLVPVQEHNEFNANILHIAGRLQQDSAYNAMAWKAYNREMDPYVLTRAIACFERSFISGNSRFDQYYYQNRKRALKEDELKGMELFFSERTHCSGCHKGFNFTNYSFENNGLYTHYADSGRMRFTRMESDRGKFKVPSLRNVAVTAPYMHDGSIRTLEAVVEHYDSGGAVYANKSALLKPLYLTTIEKKQLVAFLRALTDEQFLKDKRFRNEKN